MLWVYFETLWWLSVAICIFTILDNVLIMPRWSMPGPPVHWEQLSVVRPKVSPVTSVIWALGAGGVLILVRIVYASDVCNVVKYATVSQPGQGVSSPSLLTAQHFFIGQIQILNTSLKWQHKLNSISATHSRLWWYLVIVSWSKHCHSRFLQTLQSQWSLVTLLLSRPCGAIRDVVIRRYSGDRNPSTDTCSG